MSKLEDDCISEPVSGAGEHLATNLLKEIHTSWTIEVEVL